MSDCDRYGELVSGYEEEVAKETEKYQRLRDVDLFVLDNSIRESTVGQLRGHTLESKWKIYNESKKCGFKNRIVASFSHMTRVDDIFIKQLVEQGEDTEGLFGFSEVTDAINNKIPDCDTVPVGIRKLKEAGLYNVIFEIDLGDSTYDFCTFSVQEYCELIKRWVCWTKENMNENAKIFVSFRDLPDVMPTNSTRVFHVIEFLATLPEELRLFGLMFEEPRGKSVPEEIGTWVKYIRKSMESNNWADGHLLIHVHEKFGYCDAIALQGIMSGCTGIWASVCIEGSSMGQASSAVTLVNLIRMGNKKVLERYNCQYLRQAAINVTKITTGKEPHIKQPIFGGRALDFVFDLNQEEFDLAEFFGEKGPVRITTMASNEMIQARLLNVFGEDEEFTLDMCTNMKELILEDLRGGRKEEYMSKVGLAMLFDRAGGSLSEEMRNAIVEDELKGVHAKALIAEIKARWDVWDLNEGCKRGDDSLQFDTFYNAFMAPYFSCYRCNDTKKAWSAIDMDKDGAVDWHEFYVYLHWAIRQYPDTATADELLDCAFTKGLIPAMRDEVIAKRGCHPDGDGGDDTSPTECRIN